MIHLDATFEGFHKKIIQFKTLMMLEKSFAIVCLNQKKEMKEADIGKLKGQEINEQPIF